MNYEQLIAHYGTQRAAGEALKAFDGLGVSQPSVAEWKEKGIPAPRQAQYEVLTGGGLRADRVEAIQLPLRAEALPESSERVLEGAGGDLAIAAEKQGAG